MGTPAAELSWPLPLVTVVNRFVNVSRVFFKQFKLMQRICVYFIFIDWPLAVWFLLWFYLQRPHCEPT